MLEGAVLKFGQAGKCDDLSVHFIHELSGVAQHRPPQIGVLPHSQVTVEAGGQLQQGRNRAFSLHFSFRRLHNAGNCLQQRALSGTVGADNAQHIALVQGKSDIFIRPEFRHLVVLFQPPHDVFFQADVLKIAGHVTDRNIFYV